MSKLFENRKKHFLSIFPPKVCVPVTQELLKISQYPYRYWFLNFSVGILPIWFSPRDMGISMRLHVKNCTNFQWLKTKCRLLCIQMIRVVGEHHAQQRQKSRIKSEQILDEMNFGFSENEIFLQE